MTKHTWARSVPPLVRSPTPQLTSQPLSTPRPATHPYTLSQVPLWIGVMLLVVCCDASSMTCVGRRGSNHLDLSMGRTTRLQNCPPKNTIGLLVCFRQKLQLSAQNRSSQAGSLATCVRYPVFFFQNKTQWGLCIICWPAASNGIRGKPPSTPVSA